MKKTFNVLSVRLFGLAVVIAAIALNAMLITGCNDEPDNSSTHADGKYDAIDLKAYSWNDNGFSGESWDSYDQIKLSDFANVKELKQYDTLKFKISGVSDKELKYFQIHIFQRYGDGWSFSKAIGSTSIVSIPKTFDSVFDVTIASDSYSSAIIYVNLTNTLWQKYSGEYLYNSGETLGNTPVDTVMATIKNFSISLISIVKGDDGGGNEPLPVEPEGFEENVFALPVYISADKTTTGEYNSKLYKFTGDDFTKIKNANPGSQISITYNATVNYAIGEAGWIDINNASPVISGDGTGKRQTVNYDIADLVLGTDNFTIHIFNGATLADVTLHAAPEGYEPLKNQKATAGATKIVIPQGHMIIGRGDLSKADFKKITTAASGSLVFYFDDTTDTESGILKFGPVSKDPYKHYGISNDGTIVDGSEGWRAINAATKTITYNVSDIKKAVTDARTYFPSGTFNKLEINNDASGREGVLLYIELKP